MPPILTFVIPCYNSFSKMQRSLQFFEDNFRDDIEIIIVDDSSSDHSYENLVTFASTARSHITVERNEINSGPGVARNKGIDMASGTYITFLDADDYYDDSLYEHLLPVLRENVDLAVCDYKIVGQDGRITNQPSFFKPMTEGAVSTAEALVFLRGMTVCKFYKRKLLEDSGIRFLAQKRCEDIPFAKSLISFCKTIQYIQLPLYSYVQTGTSLMHQSVFTNAVNEIKAFEYIQSKIDNRWPLELEAIFVIEQLSSTAVTNVSCMNRKEWKKYVASTEAMFPNYKNNPYLPQIYRSKLFVIRLVQHHAYTLLKLYFNFKPLLKRLLRGQ